MVADQPRIQQTRRPNRNATFHAWSSLPRAFLAKQLSMNAKHFSLHRVHQSINHIVPKHYFDPTYYQLTSLFQIYNIASCSNSQYYKPEYASEVLYTILFINGTSGAT